MDGEAGQTILVTEELLPDLLGRHVLLVPAQSVSDMEEQSDKKTSETKENTNSQASENEVNESEVNKNSTMCSFFLLKNGPEVRNYDKEYFRLFFMNHTYARKF